MAEETTPERSGLRARLLRRGQTRAARTAIEASLRSSPEVARSRTKQAIERAIGRAEERALQGRETSADLRTMSHASRVHKHQARTLTVPGREAGFPDAEAVGFLTTWPGSSETPPGGFDWNDRQVYVARYPHGEGRVQLDPLTLGGLAEMGDQDLTRLNGLADQVLTQESQERTRAGVGAITVF